MKPVTNDVEIEESSRKTIETLYGNNIEDFKVRVVLPNVSDENIAKGGLPNSERRDSWDVQVTFYLDGIQYTVDLIITENNGQITYVRLIDKMTPL
jgi:LEA14-like dessication related protein